jgi:hypothetical protein
MSIMTQRDVDQMSIMSRDDRHRHTMSISHSRSTACCDVDLVKSIKVGWSDVETP